MSVLFGKRRRKETEQALASSLEARDVVKASFANEVANPNDLPTATGSASKAKKHKFDGSATLTSESLGSFLALGLDPSIVKKCELVGICHPTPVQAHCIPPILHGQNVLGCAQTGSGKTAAFALPILHALSKDVYGPFAVVLTPTRELAFQIADQFAVLGSSMGIRCSVVVGGVDMLKQALELQQRPHVIIATPGRLHDHLMRPNPPNLALIKFLVLDEADRLLESSFAKDLSYILDCLPAKRQTLLFSATMTSHLGRLEQIGLDEDSTGADMFRFDATPASAIKTVETLQQFYLFIPAQVKMTYLMYVMSLLDPSASSTAEDSEQPKQKKKIRGKHTNPLIPVDKQPADSNSMIVFVATCHACELVGEIARQMGIMSVQLHSLMSQSRRLAALGKFKSGVCNVLISTDVASRGLDIPEVSHVLNYDLPRDSDDYIHRVGRTARAGRGGQSVSFVTQHDIALLHHIEQQTGKEMANYEENAPEKDVLKLLTDVTTATRVAKMRLTERGFDEKVQNRREKKRQQQQQQQQQQTKPKASGSKVKAKKLD